MGNSIPVTADHPLCGTWVAGDFENTDEYQEAEYSVSVVAGQFHVAAVDMMDSEAFVIMDVSYDGEWLSFTSLVPSTQRRGRSRIRLVDQDKIEFVFTFTVTEHWKRKNSV
jgi:hypothetical protein